MANDAIASSMDFFSTRSAVALPSSEDISLFYTLSSRSLLSSLLCVRSLLFQWCIFSERNVQKKKNLCLWKILVFSLFFFFLFFLLFVFFCFFFALQLLSFFSAFCSSFIMWSSRASDVKSRSPSLSPMKVLIHGKLSMNNTVFVCGNPSSFNKPRSFFICCIHK